MPKPERKWMEIEDDPIQVTEIDSTKILSVKPEERLREALLGVADLAYKLKPGQFMMVQRHEESFDPAQRIFTVKIYMEDSLPHD